jgi:hypothetical protein
MLVVSECYTKIIRRDFEGSADEHGGWGVGSGSEPVDMRQRVQIYYAKPHNLIGGSHTGLRGRRRGAQFRRLGTGQTLWYTLYSNPFTVCIILPPSKMKYQPLYFSNDFIWIIRLCSPLDLFESKTS